MAAVSRRDCPRRSGPPPPRPPPLRPAPLHRRSGPPPLQLPAAAPTAAPPQRPPPHSSPPAAHPLTPDAATLSTICRWASVKRISTGTEAITAPAMTMPKCVEYAPESTERPGCRVRFSGLSST